LRNLPIRSNFESRDGSPIRHPLYPCLASDRVRYAGQPVAMVVATTKAQAEDARDLIDFQFSELPAVCDARAASEDGATQLHDDVPGNLCFDWANGDVDAVDAALNASEHIVE